MLYVRILALSAALWLAACSSKAFTCGGVGCPRGLVCDTESGNCIDPGTILDGGGASRDGGPSRDGGIFPGLRDGGSVNDGGGVEDGGASADAGADGGPDVGQPCATSACRGDQILVCGSNNFYAPGEDCSVRHLRCIDGQCGGCQPGARRCGGTTTVEECNTDGATYSTVETCMSNQSCDSGRCVAMGACQVGGKSNQGCDYWAVDLPNADVVPQAGGVSPANAQYALVVSNTHESSPAMITISKSDNGTPVTVTTDTIPPRDLKVFNLPARNADQCGSALLCSSVSYRAYRVQSTIPVVAYQFNPLNNTNEAFSNDASLLIPTNALDREYIAVTADAQAGVDSRNRTVSWGAYVSVVGVLDAPTSVTVTVPNGVLFDVPTGATANGQVVTATLSKYQVMTLLSKPPASELSSGTQVAGAGNLSGARVVATGRVAVFAGNVASVAPHGPGSKCCADHMEEQMFPVSAWGREYVAVRSLPRRLGATAEEDLWRIIASQDGTALTYVTNSASALTGQPSTLNAGQSVEFRSRGDFIVSGSAPILLAQIMTSSNQAFDLGPGGINAQSCTPNASNPAPQDQMCTNAYQTLSRCAPDPILPIFGACQPVGDPSLTLMPPLRQFRRDYVFLTPLDYNRDYAVIVAPQGTTVTLDNVTLAPGSFSTIGVFDGVTYQRTRVVLTTRGRHVLTATMPVGLIVGGYDRDVSYGYPGGLNLESAAPDGGMADGG
jgi:hypothetical protein